MSFFEEDSAEFPLYHGMRTKKNIEEIKKKGFCAHGSPVDEKMEIINALKYFGKEKIIHSRRTKGGLVRDMIKEIQDDRRRVVWATTDKDAPCAWWAHSNPEHVSLSLHYSGIKTEEIEKYMKERFGNNCVNIKLKMTSKNESPNFNTGTNCIPPNLIESVDYCNDCKYTGKEHKKI